jgi:tetratricopeptide (TPR) repeat protein
LRDAALVELTEAVEGTRGGYRHGEVLHHLPHVRAVVGLLAGGDGWDIGQDELHLLSETGRIQSESGRTGEALAHFKALYEAYAAGGFDWYTRCVTLVGLATAYGLEGEYSAALRMKEETVQLFTTELGPDAAESLTAKNNLAVSHMDLGHYEKAHTILCAVYRGRRDHRQIGPTHRDTLIALNNLAIARGHLGTSSPERDRHRRIAHRYWVAAWERWRRIARPDDQHALDALNGLALSYRALGIPEQALAHVTDLYERRTALLGPDHPDTLGTLENKLILREEIRERGR